MKEFQPSDNDSEVEGLGKAGILDLIAARLVLVRELVGDEGKLGKGMLMRVSGEVPSQSFLRSALFPLWPVSKST